MKFTVKKKIVKENILKSSLIIEESKVRVKSLYQPSGPTDRSLSWFL